MSHKILVNIVSSIAQIFLSSADHKVDLFYFYANRFQNVLFSNLFELVRIFVVNFS